MTRRLSLFIAWLCSALLLAIPLLALYYLFNIEAFAALTQHNINLAVDWHTVGNTQWYLLWAATLGYLLIGLAGFYFLRRAFWNFARGELFSAANSRDLQRFSILIFTQALAKPIHTAISSLVLTANHGAGEKLLAISFGSQEIRIIAIAAVFWVVSNLLVEGSKLQAENQQFV